MKNVGLVDLAAHVQADVRGAGDICVSGIAYDSRRVVPGDLFVAIPGLVHDGARFATDALARGATAICGRPSVIDSIPASTPVLLVDAVRCALADLSCAWYDHPSRSLPVVGVTGTNGKTTVISLVDALLATGGPTGRWSTTRVVVAGESVPAARTTPESLELQGALRTMLDRGCIAAAVEVSSHAIELERIRGTRFAAVGFTNLSPDHLDFHGDMAAYLNVKARLFEGLSAETPAVINIGDDAGRVIAARTSGCAVAYGWSGVGPQPPYRLHDYEVGRDGLSVRLTTPSGELALRSPLFGRVNAENIAAAVALALEMGVAPDVVPGVVAAFRGEAGRFERVEVGQDFAVIVDFAHTPGALEAALRACRELVGGRLIAVFGCGGDRDRTKRPLMGEAAAQLADHVVVTSDNPRSEEPAAIVEEILAGIGDATARTEVVLDRAAAIERAVALADDGDCVLIAGKGHETEQTFADHTVPFDDGAIARAAIHSREVVS